MAEEVNAVIDAQGRGDFRTLAEAEAALQGGPYTAYVRQGHYAPGATLTISSDKCLWIFEPGVYFDSPITASGDGVCIMLGSGCIIAGLITLSGAGCSLVCENGCSLVGILTTGARCYVTGGGWDTLVDGTTVNHAIRVEGADCIIENIAAQTTGGGASFWEAVSITAGGDRVVCVGVEVINSDDRGIIVEGGGVNCLIEGCVVLASDSRAMNTTGLRTRIVGNYIASGGVTGLFVAGSGDDSVIVGNILDPAATPLDIEAIGENCVVVGNRTDGAIVDNSGTSTVANNDETPF